MPLFENSKDFHIDNSQFNDVAGDLNIWNTTINSVNDLTAEGMRVLASHISVDALHDSSARSVDTPRCHQGTRVAVKEDIMTWASQPKSAESAEEQMLWVHGPAGTGKSAIIQDLSERCAHEQKLAASFFFSYSSPTRADAIFLIPTLAYQIAQNVPCLREHIAAAAMKDPTVFKKDLGAQFAALILNPVDEARKLSPNLNNVLDGKDIFIDGLDECRWITAPLQEEVWGDEEEKRRDIERRAEAAQTLVLTTLSNPQCPFLVVVASRPERAMRQFFRKESFKQIVLDNDYYNPDADVRTFLVASFCDIHAKYQMSAPWPLEEDVERLVVKASGQFVYASTVLKFVDDPACTAERRLVTVLDLPPLADPLSQLHSLYTSIIERCTSPMESISSIYAFHSWKDTIFHVRHRTGSVDKDTVSELLDLLYPIRPSEQERLYGCLHSLVRVPSPGTRRSTLDLSFYHKSLDDFLGDQYRSTEHRSLSELLIVDWYIKACIRLHSTNHQTLWFEQLFGPLFAIPVNIFLNAKELNSNSIGRRALKEFQDTLQQFDAMWWAMEVARQGSPYDSLNITILYRIVHQLHCELFRCQAACHRVREEIQRAVRTTGRRKVSSWLSFKLRLLQLHPILGRHSMSIMLLSPR